MERVRGRKKSSKRRVTTLNKWIFFLQKYLYYSNCSSIEIDFRLVSEYSEGLCTFDFHSLSLSTVSFFLTLSHSFFVFLTKSKQSQLLKVSGSFDAHKKRNKFIKPLQLLLLLFISILIIFKKHIHTTIHIVRAMILCMPIQRLTLTLASCRKKA